MLADKWIIDRTPTTRFPSYTRGNAADVLADPVSPLGWSLCWEKGVVIGCKVGFVTFGVFDHEDYGTPPETFGLFGVLLQLTHASAPHGRAHAGCKPRSN